jgi:ubiquitin-conjugating enzyme E2 I
LSLLQCGWKPAITVKQILLGVQALLDEPNLASPANGKAADLLRKNKVGYDKAVREYAAKHSPKPDADDGSIIIL